MIGRQYPGGSVDEVAVRRDDELLELLGRRSAPRDTTAAVSLLWALTLDVDREVNATAATASGPGDAVGARRRHGARGTAIGVVIAATLSVSGVAAAVTGDPLSPYRSVISVALDDDPPAPRRGAAQDQATISREGTMTRQTGADLTEPDVVVGQAAVADAQVSERRTAAPHSTAAGKPAKQDGPSGRPDGTTGKPENPGSSADRADAAKDAKEAKEAEAAQRAEEAKDPRTLDRAETAPQPQRARAARPETKEQRDKP